MPPLASRPSAASVAQWKVSVTREHPRPDSVEAYECLINPSEFERDTAGDWIRHAVMGLTRDAIQFGRVRSREVRMTFLYSQVIAAQRFPELIAVPSTVAGLETTSPHRPLGFQRFFESLCYPWNEGERPPDVTVVWPDYLSFRAVVTNVRIRAGRFGVFKGEPLSLSAEVSFLDIRTVRRLGRELRDFTTAGGLD